MNIELPPTSKTTSGKKSQNKDHLIKNNSKLAYGYMIAIFQIAKELGLQDLLAQYYGDQFREILTASGYFAKLDSMGVSGIEFFTQKNKYFIDFPISYEGLINLYDLISDYQLDDFYKAWIAKNKHNDLTICYDLVPLTSYSENMIYGSQGYNRDQALFPQINLGLYCSIDEKGIVTPLYPFVYSGCKNNLQNFSHMATQGRKIGLQNIEFVSDGSFAVDQAMQVALDNNFDFTLGTPSEFGISVSDNLEEWVLSNNNLANHLILLTSDDRSMSDGITSSEKIYEFNGKKCRLIMYKSNAIATALTAPFTTMIKSAENDLSDVEIFTEPLKEKYGEYFLFQVNNHKSFTFSRNEKHILREFQKLGTFAILTSNLQDHHEKILQRYIDKKEIENVFDLLKNDFLSVRLKMANNDLLKGKIMLTFLALIFRKYFFDKLKKYTKTHIPNDPLTLNVALQMLCDIECVMQDGKWISTKALTEEQKMLIECFSIPIYDLE